MDNISPPIIFVDGSYFCFYRYYALQQWWRNAFPDDPLDTSCPLANPIFVEKYRKTFVEHLKQLPKKLGLSKTDTILYVAKDCKREHIWRTELYPDYKATRNKVDGIGSFFQMVYEEGLFLNGGACAILSHPRLEADDCIALSVQRLGKQKSRPIYIVTSDHDYLQLKQPNIKLMTLAFKPLPSHGDNSSDGNRDLQLKILMGDTSDNIPSAFPKCGLKTAQKCLDDQAFFDKKLAGHQTQYALNKQLVDFSCIPPTLAAEFLSSIDGLFQ